MYPDLQLGWRQHCLRFLEAVLYAKNAIANEEAKEACKASAKENQFRQLTIHSGNPMATVSTRQVNMEEANRYAGGFDDPARSVLSYAGVASAWENNGVVIRWNSQKTGDQFYEQNFILSLRPHFQKK